MEADEAYVSLWKTSRRGLGERHLSEGYPAEDFPDQPQPFANGCAYFAKHRWIAVEFAKSSLSGYEDFMIEVRIPADVYQSRYQRFEHVIWMGRNRGVELAIPADQLDELNRVGVRLKVESAQK
jgi:hypothetical protein